LLFSRSLGDLKPFKNRLMELFNYGSKSAKFDNGYLLYSAWTADSCLLDAESSQPDWTAEGGEPNEREDMDPSYVLAMKRLFVAYAIKTKGLTGKNG
jgi:hypothetical protein